MLNLVTDEIKHFVSILLKTVVLFYQLDIKNCDTSDSCLDNMLTSMVLRNPLYDRVITLINDSERSKITHFEKQMKLLRELNDETEKLQVDIKGMGAHVKSRGYIKGTVEDTDAFAVFLGKMTGLKEQWSPMQKITTAYKFIADLSDGNQERDVLFNLMLYIILR